MEDFSMVGSGKKKKKSRGNARGGDSLPGGGKNPTPPPPGVEGEGPSYEKTSAGNLEGIAGTGGKGGAVKPRGFSCRGDPRTTGEKGGPDVLGKRKGWSLYPKNSAMSPDTEGRVKKETEKKK